jgi:3-oxoacyl-[acyl-carrier protein] reductase
VHYLDNAQKADSVVQEIREQGGEAVAFAADLARADQASGLVASVARRFGGLDILINNAGIWEEDRAGGGDVAVWDRTFAVNARGAYLVTDFAVAHLEPRRGAIVFVSSTAGQRGESRHSAYAASKGALIAYTKSLAEELGPRGIRVNCVAPGWVETDMTAETLGEPGRRAAIDREIPLGRVALPDDVALPVLFLVSDLARHVHGEVLNVNGGSVLCG